MSGCAGAGKAIDDDRILSVSDVIAKCVLNRVETLRKWELSAR
jgi:hypothetical protein